MTTIIQGETRKASLWEYFVFLAQAMGWWVFIRPIEKAINMIRKLDDGGNRA